MSYKTLRELEENANQFTQIEILLDIICDTYLLDDENNGFDSIYVLLNILIAKATKDLFVITEKLFEEFRADKQKIIE